MLRSAAGVPAVPNEVQSGEVAFRSVRIESTGYTDTEIASDALNRAVTIQESCQPNEFRIGLSLYELIHVQWLERAEEVPFDGTTVGIDGYKTYRLR